ncbi:hypothetical protein [Selenomonas sp. KH1T6]|uniref:hypothetical protein n=1 Tax=Selenomonas sp. KH1T6 TaxID=3158784 RepID=UPI001587EAA9
MGTVILDGFWCPRPWGHGPQLARGRAVTGLWWARRPRRSVTALPIATLRRAGVRLRA